VRHTEKPVRVLRITGLGRIGCTMLDIVLGNHPQIESVGEVENLMRTGWISQSKEPMHQHRRKDTHERRVDEVSNRKRFESVILSLYMRRSPKVTEADPHLTIPLANICVKRGFGSRFRRLCVLECGSARERRTENSKGGSWTRCRGGSDPIS
jgi:hypothetical protein